MPARSTDDQIGPCGGRSRTDRMGRTTHHHGGELDACLNSLTRDRLGLASEVFAYLLLIEVQRPAALAAGGNVFIDMDENDVATFAAGEIYGEPEGSLGARGAIVSQDDRLEHRYLRI
jgi:hypothetical protein